MTFFLGWTVCLAAAVEVQHRIATPLVPALTTSAGELRGWRTTTVRAAGFPLDSQGLYVCVRDILASSY